IVTLKKTPKTPWISDQTLDLADKKRKAKQIKHLGKDQECLQKSIVATQKQNDIRERKNQTRFESTAAEANTSEYGGGRH
ncbi:unnamed protein product, partial [Rotaria magnacalcarata]